MREREESRMTETFGLTNWKSGESPLTETGKFANGSNSGVRWEEDQEFVVGPVKF